jgi:type VI secretion system VgrG family protein
LTSPLGDTLLFSRMRVTERLSSLFVIQLETVSLKGDIRPSALLGKSLTIKVEYDDGAVRHFNGYARALSMGGSEGRHYVYHLTLHPWLWFLSRTSDCRIFQDVAVPKIVDAVLSDEPTKAVDDRLSDAGKYERWEYCVQYRETDFNFVSRLMEQEGICYFFEHADGAHKMVLADSKEGHAAIAGRRASSSCRMPPRRPRRRTMCSLDSGAGDPARAVRHRRLRLQAPGNDLQVCGGRRTRRSIRRETTRSSTTRASTTPMAKASPMWRAASRNCTTRRWCSKDPASCASSMRAASSSWSSIRARTRTAST